MMRSLGRPATHVGKCRALSGHGILMISRGQGKDVRARLMVLRLRARKGRACRPAASRGTVLPWTGKRTVRGAAEATGTPRKAGAPAVDGHTGDASAFPGRSIVDHGLIKASQRLSELNIRVSQGGYSVDIYWFRVMFKEQDWFIKRHAHSTLEFHFIARGDCEVVLEDRSFVARQGTFFLTAPGVYHTQKPATSSELVEYSLNCDIRRVGTPVDAVGREMEWLRAVFLTTPCAPVSDAYGAFPLFESALREADRSLPGFTVAMHNLVVMILVAAARAMKGREAPLSVPAADADHDDLRMTRIEQFVTDNIGDELHPADLAAVMNLSERQIGRIVSHCKGYSTKKFITRTKMKTAKQLLCDTELPLKEIARELGFSNEFYFGSVFKKHEGYPPGLFRKSMQQGPMTQEPG
jgi:AraC-like DNA-binding protein/mannose-6-phosphate isomerase-like protein (cupin superfamily)